MRCRVCRTELGGAIYCASAPAITSLATLLDVPTAVYACSACAHCQSDDLPNLDAFYDTNYKISLASEDHDQLFEVRDGKPVYRTDRQAEAAIRLLDIKPGAKTLDYGAAKAATLRKIFSQRPDVVPHVFDVSDDYRSHWESWLPGDACATYQVPARWSGRFDVVTAHFVIEHVSDPVATLSELRGLLAPGGKLFFSIPDWKQNTGDLLVIEHANHFSETSLRTAAWRAGLNIDVLSRELPGAFVAVCSASDCPARPSTDKVKSELDDARAMGAYWTRAVATLEKSAALRGANSSAIFGVGFYGTLVHSRVARRVPVRCFIDNNPHSWSLPHFGLPVRPPAEMPDDVRTVYVGLNPSKARTIVAQTPALNRASLDLVFLGETT